MAHQIVKQPNGMYCIFSTVVDSVIVYNATEEQLINYYIEKEKKEITERVAKVIKQIEAGEKPYAQFTMTFDEMMETIKVIHGEDKVKNIFFDISKSRTNEN